MATLENIRAVALILQQCSETLYTDVLPVYGVTNSWNVAGLDGDLPPEGEVKSTLELYEQITKLPINLAPAIRDVRQSTGTPIGGLFYLPSTIFPIIFRMEGVVIPGDVGSQAFGTPLQIERVTLFCEETGSGGADLVVDVQKGGGSLFSVLPAIAANSGDDVLYIVPDGDLSETSISSADVLTTSVVSAPDDCQSVTLTIWVKAG